MLLHTGFEIKIKIGVSVGCHTDQFVTIKVLFFHNQVLKIIIGQTAYTICQNQII